MKKMKYQILKKKALPSILLTLTLVSSIYALKKSNDFNDLSNKFEKSSEQKKELQQKLDKTTANYEKLYNKNKKLSRRVISEINKIITLKDSVNELDLDLRKDKKALTRKATLTKNLTNKINDLALEVNKAKLLKASNINVLTMRKKNNGKFTKTTNTKKIDAFKINFQIHKNEVADSGKKRIHIQVIDPDNKVILSENTNNEYSDEISVDYQNEGLDIISLINVNRDNIKLGKYKVNAYVDGDNISKTFFDVN